MDEIEPLRIMPGTGIEVLDQTALPFEERRVVLATVEEVCEAIRALRVRGAPLLGLTGACGMAIAAQERGTDDGTLELAANELISTRPTATDLGAVVLRALTTARSAAGSDARRDALWDFALDYARARQDEDRSMGELGAPLLPVGGAVLTHCNTGALATGGIGSALGVIRTAWQQGRLAHCYATETRPLLQGARLTMWELDRLRMPATLLPDTAAASLIASGRVGAVITGADRIAANGDTANKVGTYALAAVAARHDIPFFIAAPTSTFDPSCPDGATIPIEFRPEAEVGGFGEQRWSPAGAAAYNPAFDVTPAALITAIISEQAVLRPPYGASVSRLVSKR
jgi:methylthioribose-1-phosphate isomerase